MTASWVAMTAARLASIASSQSMTNLSGSSATPSRDNSSYNTTLRMHTPPVERDAAYSDGSIRRNSPVRFGRDPMAGDAHSAATTAGATPSSSADVAGSASWDAYPWAAA